MDMGVPAIGSGVIRFTWARKKPVAFTTGFSLYYTSAVRRGYVFAADVVTKFKNEIHTNLS